jgi:hypothetical protein
MGASYWVKHLGYPCSVYANSSGDCTLGSGGDESNDGIRARPLASDYDNTDIYISIHTNGLSGDCHGTSCPNGTITYYDASAEHASWATISQTLAQEVQTSLMSVIRNDYGDSSWYNRGALDSKGNYGEIRIPNRAAILVELAFHDSCDRDALYLRDEFFRSATMWAVYKGVCDYFNTSPSYALYSDEYVSDTIPSEMLPGETYNVSITFRNRGVLWTSARQFRLGAVGDSDPFTAFNRVSLPADVGTGQTCTFEFTMTAPLNAGTYTTDWRMVRDGVTWYMRDTIVNVSDTLDNYTPGVRVTLDITLDPVAWKIQHGDRLRFDISSSDFPTYNAHANTSVPWYSARRTRVAHNTVYMENTSFELKVR